MVEKNRLNGGPRREISTCDTPTPRNGVLYVERLKGEDRQSFIVYSPCLRGFLSHWTGTKTVPCWKDHSLCEGGHKEETLRENFMLHCWSIKKGKQLFVYLTPQAADELNQQLQPGQSMRGLKILVWRTASDKGRLHVTVDEAYRGDLRRIPPEIDAYDSVLNFLKVPHVDRAYRRSLGSFTEPEEGDQGA